MAVELVKMKKGVAPLIAWIGILGVSIVLAISASVWYKDFSEELSLGFLKFGVRALECGDISLHISSQSNCSFINITNTGLRTVEKVKIQYLDPVLDTSTINGPIFPKSSVLFTGPQALSLSLLPIINFEGEDLGCFEQEIEIDNCVYVPICGDNKAEQGEACDGSDLNGKSCQSFGYTSGTLSCNSCQFDTSQCSNETYLSYIWDTITEYSLGTFLQTLSTQNDVVLDDPSTNLLGDGSDGVLTVTASDTIVNSYTYLTSNVSSSSVSIDVNDVTGFSVGNEILILQTQHSSNAGIYEFKKINLILGSTLTLDQALTNSYTTGIFNISSSDSTQIVGVPQYTTVNVQSGSITSKAWDGYSGGIIVFRNTGMLNVSLGASINSSFNGFRRGVSGGDGPETELGRSNTGGATGSSGGSAPGAGGNGGGSGSLGGNGGASCSGSGQPGGTGKDGGAGGGGFHYGVGSCESFGEFWGGGGGGGASYDSSQITTPTDFSRIMLGAGASQGAGGGGKGVQNGGGGSGGRADGIGGTSYGNTGVSGERGGGIIMIFSNSLNVLGNIVADGGNGGRGGNGAKSGVDSQGGGGEGGQGASGGSIYLSSETINLGTSLVTTKGGAGGNGGNGQAGFSCSAGTSGTGASFTSGNDIGGAGGSGGAGGNSGGCSGGGKGGNSGYAGKIRLDSNDIAGTTNPSAIIGSLSSYYSSGNFTSQVLDVSSSVTWNLFSWESELFNETLDINVRSCDDILCSGESWTSLTSTPANLSLPNNRYFQFKSDFSTSDTSKTPKLNKAIVNYTSS